MPKAKTTIKSAGGIGESKIFCEPPGPNRLETAVDRLLKCHIDGVLISDMNLAPQVLSALPYDATDEGIAEANAKPGPRASGISVGKEGFEKALDQRRDDVLDRDMELFEARDPMKEVADQYAVPGMKPKFLSASRVKENGGTGMYQVVKNEDGDPVRVKGMILAHVPEAKAEARNRHYRERGNMALKQITDQYKKEGGSTAVVDQ